MTLNKTIILSAVAFLALLSCPAGPMHRNADVAAGETKTIAVDTPDLCTNVERVSGKTIYLRSGQGNCPSRGTGRARVVVDGSLQEVHIYVDGKLWKKQNAAMFDVGNVPEATNRAKNTSERMEIPKNVHQGAASDRALDLHYYFQSEEFQKKVEAEKDRLQGKIFGNSMQSYYPHSKALKKPGNLSANERIYIFISSSVPLETLRNYIRTVAYLKDPNIRLIMRGFVGGVRYIKPTISFLKDILLENPKCNPLKDSCAVFAAQVMIDPMLFGKYRIDRVPAIVYAPSVSVVDDKMSEGLDSNAISSNHYLLYGDVGLEYAIEKLFKETSSAGLQKLLSAYRDHFYK